MKAPMLYGLFERHWNGRNWVRLGVQAYPLGTARQVFQDRLLAYPLGYASRERMLRPVGRGMVFVGLGVR